jgi:hypothetical protein
MGEVSKTGDLLITRRNYTASSALSQRFGDKPARSKREILHEYPRLRATHVAT